LACILQVYHDFDLCYASQNAYGGLVTLAFEMKVKAADLTSLLEGATVMATKSVTSTEDQPGRDRRGAALAVLALAQLMVVLDATIVNIALPSAQRALGFSVADRQWVVTAYALAFGSLLLLGGRLADIAGRRRMFLIGLSGFAVASAVGGAAGNFATLVAARAAQGAFGALLAPAALSLLTVTFTESKERRRALAVFSAVSGGGAAVGLLLGGLLTQYLSWRYCMYVNVVFAAVAITGGLALLREPAARTRSRLDAASVITVSAGLFALVYGFSRAETDGWTSPVTLGALAAGVVLLTAFSVLQAKVASPLLPLRVLADRTRAGAYLAILTVGISVFGMFLFVTYYLQQNLRFSAVAAGLAFLPMTFALAVAAQLSIRRIVPTAGPRAAITPGLLLAAAGAFLLTRLGAGSDYVNLVLPATLLFGAGLGMVISASIATATAGIGPADAGAASALVNVGQQVGGSIGTSLLNTLAASAVTSYAAAHARTPHLATLASLHGYDVGFAWAAAILLAAALITAALLRRPAATTAPAGTAIPARATETSPASPARCPETCGSRA
jgi:EmrB/QacA subfamily drug resistance transporter